MVAFNTLAISSLAMVATFASAAPNPNVAEVTNEFERRQATPTFPFATSDLAGLTSLLGGLSLPTAPAQISSILSDLPSISVDTSGLLNSFSQFTASGGLDRLTSGLDSLTSAHASEIQSLASVLSVSAATQTASGASVAGAPSTSASNTHNAALGRGASMPNGLALPALATAIGGVLVGAIMVF